MKGKVLHLVMSSIYRFRLLAFIVFKQLFHLNIILSSILIFNLNLNIHSFVIIVIIYVVMSACVYTIHSDQESKYER